MGTAYTPGLTVSPGTTIRKTRRLPLKGQVTVNIGDHVTADTVVARTEIPGVIQTVRVAEILGLEPAEAISALKVQQGDKVESGQLLAETRSFFGLIRTECKSPIAGTVELISNTTGHVGIRLPSTPVEVTAYIDGTVADIIPEEGVVVETYGALVQGIFGVGGERTGTLVVPAESADTQITEEHIKNDHAGAVIVGGTGITLGALRKAASIGAQGVVVGAITDTDLIAYLGHDIGVAITGQEDIPTTLILTEGFGSIRMAQRTFDLLKSLEGRKVSINGATQIRAGVIRPEVIAPLEKIPDTAAKPSKGQLLEVGSNIRIIREPYFGMLGTVTKLPPEPVEIESGAVVRILEAELLDGTVVRVPRANVEIIEG
jgi:biotin carboxyl carrier protein